jgi:hypothetical protein
MTNTDTERTATIALRMQGKLDAVRYEIDRADLTGQLPNLEQLRRWYEMVDSCIDSAETIYTIADDAICEDELT